MEEVKKEGGYSESNSYTGHDTAIFGNAEDFGSSPYSTSGGGLAYAYADKLNDTTAEYSLRLVSQAIIIVAVISLIITIWVTTEAAKRTTAILVPLLAAAVVTINVLSVKDAQYGLVGSYGGMLNKTTALSLGAYAVGGAIVAGTLYGVNFY